MYQDFTFLFSSGVPSTAMSPDIAYVTGRSMRWGYAVIASKAAAGGGLIVAPTRSMSFLNHDSLDKFYFRSLTP